MAEATVTFLLTKLDNWLTREWGLPEEIKTGIDNLKRDLEMIRATFKDSDARIEQENQIRVWIQQLRDEAHKIENVLEMYAHQNMQRGALPWYAGWPRVGNKPIHALIQEIDQSLKRINKLNETYRAGSSSHHASTSSDHEPGIAPLYTPEAEIVGFELPRAELVSWVLDVERSYKVMFVVGMGGSGKTALVKLVYEQLKDDFECKVWITASKSKKSQELLSTMLSKLLGYQTAEFLSHSLQDLVDMLNGYLQGKRYLIVIDDLWIREIWESVKFALPREKSSRVIITTRRGDIASSCRENSIVDVYNIPALPLKEARELFSRRAFQQGDMYPEAQGRQRLLEKLLEKCEGLPLGIIEIGKLLSNRVITESELKKLHDSLQSELTSGQLSSTRQVLLLSYNDLPEHLKYCFLYMSMFGESYLVKRRTLIRLWIAEDFIKGENGKQPEDIGEEYLKELMERNLIQANELDFDGRPRTCRVHSLMHKIALSKSEAENFCAVWTNPEDDISGKTRRLSIQHEEFNMSYEIPCKIGSLFTNCSLRTAARINSTWKLLKILHLDGACVDVFPDGIKELLLLKYLCLSNTKIKMIPMSIRRLRLLETLNLKQTFVTSVPTTLAELGELRHLLIRRYNVDFYDTVHGFKIPKIISQFTNLQKLSFVKADGDPKLIQELGKLTKLRKLGIIDLPGKSGPILCETIQKLENLHTLDVTSLRDEVLRVQDINNPPPLLQRLNLKGLLEKMPRWILKLHDLIRIHLKGSRLENDDNDPITILGELPNLLELQLLDAYMGRQLEFNAGQFQKLKILGFEQMGELKVIVIEKGAIPCLQKLSISQCQNIQLTTGIENVTQLKELHLSDLPSDFVNSLRKDGAMRSLVQHIENIYINRPLS